MKKNITCFCSRNFQFEYNEEINLDEKPEIFNQIMEGSFMSVNCPSCGKRFKPELKIKITWKSKNLIMDVIPELERGEYYRNKKEKSNIQAIIGFPEMADRLSVIKDDLDPVVIETIKSFLLAKAAEDYPENDVNAWYHSGDSDAIVFHLDGIKEGEMAVMKIPKETYNKTLDDYKKHPKKSIYTSLLVKSYLSVQNLLRPDALK
ncbi:MAG: CpXC domain-containing protein [Treponema sp.]|nr:CpXC domain-containing protein [Treponema sp.]